MKQKKWGKSEVEGYYYSLSFSPLSLSLFLDFTSCILFLSSKHNFFFFKTVPAVAARHVLRLRLKNVQLIQ